MKKLLFLLFCLPACATAWGQVQDNCDAPASVRAFYRQDAAQLALREMQGNPFYDDSVRVPQNLHQFYLRSLLAVYNATQFPERDTVVECFGIHAFPAPYPYSLLLQLDLDEAWVQNLNNNILPTGNATVDALMAEFQLVKNGGFSAGGSLFTSLRSLEPLHMPALAQRFDPIPGVVFAEPDGLAGDGNDIRVEFSPTNVIYLTYSIAWGDCFAGCIERRNWRFRVNHQTCAVQFEEAFGSEIDPVQIGCSDGFACEVEPLCLGWVRDTILHYKNTFQPPCTPDVYGGMALVRPAPGILGLRLVIGTDYEFMRYYSCNGQFLGECTVTIVGYNCSPDWLEELPFGGDTLWQCFQPLPSTAECGLLAAPSPAGWAASLQVSPNPSADWLRVTADFGRPERGQLRLFNSTGQLMTQRNFNTANLSEILDIQHYPSGMYALVVETPGQTAVRKVVRLGD
jgi:hypothetical protein